LLRGAIVKSRRASGDQTAVDALPNGSIAARRLAQFLDYIRHPGQGFVMVLSGRVRIHFETCEAIDLGRRESAYFDSGVGHVDFCNGRADAQ
jgi:hypothetical protein